LYAQTEKIINIKNRILNMENKKAQMSALGRALIMAAIILLGLLIAALAFGGLDKLLSGL
jgi:hypothetical protein